MPHINPQIQPWTCPYCRRVNPPKTYDCRSCGAPLLEEYIDSNYPDDVPYGDFDSPYFPGGIIHSIDTLTTTRIDYSTPSDKGITYAVWL